MANKAGKITNLPVSSIDRLILDSLVENSCLAALSVNDLIQKAFFEVAPPADLIECTRVGTFLKVHFS